MSQPVKLDKANIGDIFSLTPLQEGMLFYYLRDPQGDMFFEQVALRIGGSVDPGIAESAWKWVVANNGMLRTVFRWQQVKRPLQLVLKSHPPDLRFVDFSGNHESDPDSLLRDFLQRDRGETFDLRSVPFRVSVCRFNRNDTRIVLSHHHILYDGWSTGIVLGEFFETYRCLLEGKEPVEKRSLPFSRFVKWLNQQDPQKGKAFWTGYLAGYTDSTPSGNRIIKKLSNSHHCQISLNESLQLEVETFAASSKTTPAAVYTAAWGLLMQLYSGRSDVLFDTTVAGRPPDIEGGGDVVGLFINTIPCRVRTLPDDAVRNFLSRFHAELQDRQKYENVPLRQLELENVPVGHVPFKSLLVIENYPVAPCLVESSGPLPVVSISNYGINDYDLTVLVKMIGGNVEFQFIYYNELFESGDIDDVATDYLELLKALVNSPEIEVEALLQRALSSGGQRVVERAANRAGAESGVAGGEEIIPPRSVTEARLQTVFAAVLRLDPSSISVDYDFFQFGGHSMRASQLTARIQREFNVQIPLIQVFQLKTVSALAAYIEGEAKGIGLPVAPCELRDYYPLSSAQTRMFVLQLDEAVGTTYNIPLAFVVEGELEAGRLEEALRRLILRHDSLRTMFDVAGSQPIQRILDTVEFNIERIDASADTLEGAVREFVRPFDLSRPPLLRVGLAALESHRHLLVIDIHHIISDGFSNFLLLRDLISLYRGRPLSSIDVQYKDFAVWERRFKSSTLYDRQRRFWLDRFKTMPTELNVPARKGDNSTACFQGDVVHCDVSEELTGGVRELAAATNTTVFNVMLAAFYVLLARYTRQEDIVVGFPVTGRSRAEFQPIAGMFVNMLPLRCSPRGNQSFIDFLFQVRDSVWRAMENQDFPFNELVLGLGLSGERGKNPLFKAAFTMHDMNRASGELESIDLDRLYLREPDLRLVPYRFKRDVTAFELHMVAREKERSIEMEFDFSHAVFSRAAAEDFVRRYQEILDKIVGDRDVTLEQIEISTGYETVSAQQLRSELDGFDF
jgi:non-ribosomal peptide synthetase component F